MNAVALSNIKVKKVHRFGSTWPEMDWVCGVPSGWGIPYGTISAWSGPPGVGKTRLAVQIIKQLDKVSPGFKSLIFQGELSTDRFAGEKMGGYQSSRIFLSSAVNIDEQIEIIKQVRPNLVVTDSVQQVEEYEGGRGAKTIVRRLREVIEEVGCHVIFLSQVTLQGHTKGGTQLPHEVDIVVEMAKEQDIVKFNVIKNRFGKSGEWIGFRHQDWGVECVSHFRLYDKNWCHSSGETLLRGATAKVGFLRRMGKVARSILTKAVVFVAAIFLIK
jgi:predicted ATP-dependent serine protease